MKNWGSNFTPEMGGHFELELVGHFKLNWVVNITRISTIISTAFLSINKT